MGERIQSLSIASAGSAAGDIDRPNAINALVLHFPPPALSKGDGTPPTPDTLYTSKILGTFTTASEIRATRPGVALNWKAPGAAPGASAEILFLAFDRVRPGLDLQWKTTTLLKNPDLFNAVYWLLENSAVELVNPANAAAGKNQRILFKPLDLSPITLNDSEGAIAWPVELPRETAVTAPRLASLPTGWEVSWAPEWEVKDPVLRSTANSSQVLKFRKATSSGAIDALFLVTFRPGLNKVECTLTKRRAADQADLARAQSDLKDLDAKVEKAKSDAMGAAIETFQSGKDLLEKRNQTKLLVDAYTAALAAYHEIKGFDVAFDQSDGVRLQIIHFVQKE